ncbi:unnamed protein product [Adineta steineri]|uniref:G-protein coupled receptors family 1 profile domain-containing protein n=1 Tax=Adineta steineri TaxID=433720 RepID=A0A814FGF0_9BILA|nr:unnamed protein product [Adineta steineri]CAF1012292.1 unnamed protein product [Adineta steineri]CAF1050885.1 unnamed protein product [Adineta steineri]
MVSLTFTENSTKTSVEPWFIPCDIFMLICNILTITLTILFLILIILDKTYRTVPMVLVGNSCLTILCFACTMLGATSSTIEKDLKQIQYQDPLCIFFGYLMYATPTVQNYSILLQAIYRYLLIVHPTLRYVKRMNRVVTAISTLSRAQRELKMVRRTVILISILVTLFIPYQLFAIMSFFNFTIKYDFRIAFLFGDTGMLCVVIALFKFTDPLKTSLMKRINKWTNTTVAPLS